MLEILVTHNEPVTRDDLACALGISSAEVWDLAGKLQTVGQVELDEHDQSVAATPAASEPGDAN
jgi:DNA-binding IclR family transcriptional regulator